MADVAPAAGAAPVPFGLVRRGRRPAAVHRRRPRGRSRSVPEPDDQRTPGPSAGAADIPPALRTGTAAGRWVLATTVLGSGVAFLDGTVVNLAPEHADCERAARRSGAPVKTVWAQALAAAHLEDT